ncbi:hypothetical protein SRHO_G00028090 [Serrasalmus rhombeus]
MIIINAFVIVLEEEYSNSGCSALVVVLAKAIKRAVYVMCLVVFIMYIFAVAGVLYFREQTTGDVEHWGDLGSALLTIFSLITPGLFIIINKSFVIALEEEYSNPGLFGEAEWIFLILYVLEFSMRVYVEPRSFWRSGFNIFSSALLLLSLVAEAMKRAVYVMCLVFFIMFIFAVAGVLYFGEQTTGDTEHWGDLGSALLTIFGLITLDSWVDLLRKVDGLGVAYSRLFPIIFILKGHFIFFNMFLGLVIMEVDASKLKKWSDTNVRTDEHFPQIIQQLRMSDSYRIVTKNKSSSLTFPQIYLIMLRHQAPPWIIPVQFNYIPVQFFHSTPVSSLPPSRDLVVVPFKNGAALEFRD